ncbi:hypothetical protein C2845_PM01G01540 [Panicum miliaceum]|uniref:Ubiquitin-like protease family profile domain-containing protein n=1 Tax=Panicum miliaceum TaxID=4540 RepID=A0A3L6TGK5_PANMI|nr:hypothetical protein C2845_PM01G01540 [Panicum miliaceum]
MQGPQSPQLESRPVRNPLFIPETLSLLPFADSSRRRHFANRPVAALPSAQAPTAASAQPRPRPRPSPRSYARTPRVLSALPSLPGPADSLDCIGAGSDVECFDAGAEDAAPLLPMRLPAALKIRDGEGDAAVSASLRPRGRRLINTAGFQVRNCSTYVLQLKVCVAFEIVAVCAVLESSRVCSCLLSQGFLTEVRIRVGFISVDFLDGGDVKAERSLAAEHEADVLNGGIGIDECAKLRRNRASPARLLKLDKVMSEEQRKMGGQVKYELDVDAINFMQNKYDIIQGSAPKIDEIVKRVEQNKFVVDQLKDAAKKIDKKNSIKGCILFLVILYADSLMVENIEIPTNRPRIAAWTRKLLDLVIKQDTNRDGSFGKLKKKRKICGAVSKVLCGVTELLGTLIQEMVAVEEDSPAPSTRRSKRKKTRGQVHENAPRNHGAPEDAPSAEDNEDFIPLSSRLKRMQSVVKEDVRGQATTTKQTKWDDRDGFPTWSLDGISAEEYALFEAEAIKNYNKLKEMRDKGTPHSASVPGMHKMGVTATPPSVAAAGNTSNLSAASSSKQKDNGSRTASFQATPAGPAGTSSAAAKGEAIEGDSITPDYAPTPRRLLKTAAAMQSPYVGETKKMSFKCCKAVLTVYNAVCMCSGRTTRMNNRNEIIINYLSNHATLVHLADSVRPGGKLKNTIAEIGIYVMNGKKTKGATRRVLPLHVSTLIQHHQLGMAAVTRVFRKDINNLDHRQLVIVPVLQMLVANDENLGHYFLIVLNLRNQRFEVIDSMRSLQDEKLPACCNTIISGIKSLWRTHYPNTKTPIDNYGTTEIAVPKRRNK